MERAEVNRLENGHKFNNTEWVDPAELMLDNPAALIVNREMYERMKRHFAPERLDPPQVVWVNTYSSTHGHVIRRFVVDGMTRTKFAADYKDLVFPEYPGFDLKRLMVRDVTEAQMMDPTVVPITERLEGARALTMIQYLRAVVPPTVEHSQIAPDRIAAHLINGWENIIGADLAEKFPAIAALDFFSDRNVPTANKNDLRRYLDRQGELFVDEQPLSREDRERLFNGLGDMAQILVETKLIDHKPIIESAFSLVSTKSPVIGGEKETTKQIYGLLHLPLVAAKIGQSAENNLARVRRRDELGKTIMDLVARFAGTSQGETIVASVQEVLRNPDLKFEHVLVILRSDNPAQKYAEVRRD